jgi:serine/threonine protein phosphatase PrpC
LTQEARKAVVAKKLRLAVAELTDVGRKRERNQDNVTHQVPQDEEVLQERGALFVVCDGMGGHAAGEIASQLGAETIRDAYYAAPEKEIISALAHAIDQANQAIYNHAREHPELTGMGTTCVSLVLAGGRAYIVNIGDSRAYVARNGKLRQITQDHSWVAEQVRVGLLSEEQARHHSHRNVITRSLGTQPNVTADLFIETVRDGDRLLLCSDGLHGYVEEADIEREMLNQMEPGATAHKLIAMANENGGPDNITALVVHLLEAPEPVGELNLPGATPTVENGVTQPLPVVSNRPQPVVARSAKAKSRPVVSRGRTAQRVFSGMLTIALLLAVAFGAWYYFFGPLALQRDATAHAQQEITRAHQTIQSAGSQDPEAALASLSRERQALVDAANDPNADESVRQQARALLSNEFAAAVQSAAFKYTTTTHSKTVPSDSLIGYQANTCTPPGGSTAIQLGKADALATVLPPPVAPQTKPVPPPPPPPPAQYLYIISAGTLYRVAAPADGNLVPQAGALACIATPPPDVSSVLSIIGDGTALYALAYYTNSSYAVLALTPDASVPNSPTTLKLESKFVVPTPNGEKPAHLAEQGGVFYVTYGAGSNGQAGVLIYSGDVTKNPPKDVKLDHEATSVVATNNTLYFLLSDGTLGQLDSAQAYKALPVKAPQPLVSSGFDPSAYAAATPVPTPVTAADASGTHFAATSVLSADPGSPTHLYLADVGNDRIIRFTASATGLEFNAQYLQDKPRQDVSALTVVSANSKPYLFQWSGGKVVTFVAPDA